MEALIPGLALLLLLVCLFVLSVFLPLMSPNEYLCLDSVWENMTRTEVPEHLGGG